MTDEGLRYGVSWLAARVATNKAEDRFTRSRQPPSYVQVLYIILLCGLFFRVRDELCSVMLDELVQSSADIIGSGQTVRKIQPPI
jgi:hypothetical protein